jgi:uncharacterized membrane protein YdfJ with MMPL/SSD domain
MMSVAAASGVMVLVWQQGHGSQALWSIPATGAITVWVPIMVFAFLFGLSMDYEVFILSRIREEYDRTGSTDAAVVVGIGSHAGERVRRIRRLRRLGAGWSRERPITESAGHPTHGVVTGRSGR